MSENTAFPPFSRPVLESTSVYSIHIASFLSACEAFMPYKPYVYCVNPKMTTDSLFSDIYGAASFAVLT